MFRVIHKKKAQAAIEYVVVIVLIIGAFLVFQKYIARAFYGRWKGVGDQWGHGMQYDPQKTLECAFDFRYTNAWYDLNCFEDNCINVCVRQTSFDQDDCEDCILTTCSAGGLCADPPPAN